MNTKSTSRRARTAQSMTDLDARVKELEREQVRTLEIRRVITDYNIALLDMDKARARVHQAAEAMRAVVLRDETSRRPNMETWTKTMDSSSAGQWIQHLNFDLTIPRP